MSIVIKNAGMLSTIQDKGRYGYQRFGVPVSGVMDMRSYIIANELVGNCDSAVIEAAIIGPTIEFKTDNAFAITGADLSPCLNNRPISNYCSIAAKGGDILSFKGRKSGCRAYIAFAGGLDVPLVMNSRSTYVKAGLGGINGRKLEAGDTIRFIAPNINMNNRYTEPENFEGTKKVIRVILGPQDDYFTDEGIKAFLTSEYTVLPQSDRMGYRFDGPAIEHIKDGNIISDGISFGAIQVSSNGKPIILMADRQTIGGYTKIANVISADLPVLAQCMPGDIVMFESVTINSAQSIYLDECIKISDLRSKLSMKASTKVRHYIVKVNGTDYNVGVEELKK